VTPVIIWAVVKKLIVDPIVHEQKERDKVKQRELNKARYFYYSNLKTRKCSKMSDSNRRLCDCKFVSYMGPVYNMLMLEQTSNLS